MKRIAAMLLSVMMLFCACWNDKPPASWAQEPSSSQAEETFSSLQQGERKIGETQTVKLGEWKLEQAQCK